MNPSGRKNHFFLNHVPRVFSIERLRNQEAEEHIVYTYISIIDTHISYVHTHTYIYD